MLSDAMCDDCGQSIQREVPEEGIVDLWNEIQKNYRLQAELDQRPAWVSVDERLPEKNGEYWVLLDGVKPEVGNWVGEDRMWNRNVHWFDHDDVTHWMPIPPLPDNQEVSS